MRYSLVILILSIFATTAHAQGIATFQYQRGVIHVMRKNATILPWQEGETAEPVPSVLDIKVDIRSSKDMYRQDGWMNMGKFSTEDGAVYLFDPPEIAYVRDIAYTHPLDILWVDTTGKITSIAPQLVLQGLPEPISDQKPSRALLILGAGMVENMGIQPGDKLVDSEFFVPPPKILTAPEP